MRTRRNYARAPRSGALPVQNEHVQAEPAARDQEEQAGLDDKRGGSGARGVDAAIGRSQRDAAEQAP